MNTKFKQIISDIILWNYLANDNNKPKFNRHLEASMLTEELSELIIAMKENDKVEMADAFADIIFVLVGTMWKAGFNEVQLTETVEEVIKSNFSKFEKIEQDGGKIEYKVLKDESGKIMKPETFKKPNIENILNKQ